MSDADIRRLERLAAYVLEGASEGETVPAIRPDPRHITRNAVS